MSRIKSNTPVYVAGFERGVLPIGDWSILIILSIFCKPFTIFLHLPGFSFAPFNFLLLLFYIVLHLLMLTFFREPDTPVTQLNTPNGNFTLIFFKLFSVAPCTSITFVFRCFSSFLGTSIFFSST